MAVELEFDYDKATAAMDIFSQEDIDELFEWTQSLDKIKCVPKDLSNKQLVLFYNACYGDMKKTKACIEKYYQCRKNGPELFDNRILSREDLTHSAQVLEFAVLPGKSVQGYDIIYHRLHETEPSKYNLEVGIRLLFMTVDSCLSKRGPQPGYMFLFDMRGVKFGHLTRVSLGSLRKFFTYIQEAMPVRMRAIHVLNTEPVLDKLMLLIRPFMDKKFFDMIVMDLVDNNQFEITSANSKRKIVAPCPNAYLNPALDLLANEDPMCNTAMEIPIKKRKRNRSCSDIAVFENTALDLGTIKAPVNEFLVREIENVTKNVRHNNTNNEPCMEISEISTDVDGTSTEVHEPIYANLTEVNTLSQENSTNSNITDDITALSVCTQNDETLQNITDINKTAQNYTQGNIMRMSIQNDDIDSGISVLEQKSLNTTVNDDTKHDMLSPITNIQTNVTNQLFINNSTNLNLSFIDRLALDSPNLSNQSLFYDDDLNESNIMEIKTITIITKKKRINTNSKNEIKNTNPFLDPNLVITPVETSSQNPFLNLNSAKPELEYSEEVLNRPLTVSNNIEKVLEPRRLFSGDTNSTMSTVNESIDDQHEYENVDTLRGESPIYENIEELSDMNNKQSRILGHDVSQFRAIDIMNLNKNTHYQDSSNDSNEIKKKNPFLKVRNKLSKKVFKTLKKIKGEKTDSNSTLNPYEVPRKPPKQKVSAKDSGIENPALKLDNSDEIEIEELEDEHEYETVKTLRNTHYNTNITPLKERNDIGDTSHNRTNTPGKKVRFDSTLNQEKVITGNSFDDIQSPGFDAKIDKYHDELENCINERKFLQQNM